MIDGTHSRILAEIHAEEVRAAPNSLVGIERFIRFVGRPWLAFSIAAFLAAWFAADEISIRVNGHPFIGPGFPSIGLVISLCSLSMTLLILIAENHQGMIAERRAQVTLQIALVSEQKIAKVIELLERLRHDDPGVPNRRDDEAARMSEATDLRVALSEMDEAVEAASVQPQS
jgi:uncharacterized membrane protein